MKKLLFLPIFMIFTIQGMSPDADVWILNGIKYRKVDLALFDHVTDENIELIDELVKKGADINAIGTNQISLVMQMTMLGRKKVVDRLIELGVRLNDIDSEGNSLLMFNPTGRSAGLLIYLMIPDINTIEKLIRAGANVNTQNKRGSTPLIFAASRGKLDLVKLFVKYGALIDHRDIEDKNAIDIAQEQLKHENDKAKEYQIEEKILSLKQIIDFLEKTRAENIEKRKRIVQEEAAKYISTGSYGPLQYVLEYAEEYVPELEL